MLVVALASSGTVVGFIPVPVSDKVDTESLNAVAFPVEGRVAWRSAIVDCETFTVPWPFW